MASNFGYVGTGAGIIKLVHILFGIITLGCIAASFEHDRTNDKFFLSGVTIVFILSLIYLLVHLISEGLARSGANRLVNVVYHFFGAVFLIVGASLFLQTSVKQNNEYCKGVPPSFSKNSALCKAFPTKAAAGSFGIINGILYLVAIALTAGGDSYDDDNDIGIDGYTTK